MATTCCGGATLSCRTIHAVVAGGKSLSLDELTPRERDVLEAIAKGLDNAEIARSLRLSEKTVRNHITRIFDKIRVKHRYQAIVMAREAGLGGAASSPVGAEAGHLSRALGATPTPRRDIGLNTTAFARPRCRHGVHLTRRHANHGEAQSRRNERSALERQGGLKRGRPLPG